jgi:hypothetical protein
MQCKVFEIRMREMGDKYSMSTSKCEQLPCSLMSRPGSTVYIMYVQYVMYAPLCISTTYLGGVGNKTAPRKLHRRVGLARHIDRPSKGGGHIGLERTCDKFDRIAPSAKLIEANRTSLSTSTLLFLSESLFKNEKRKKEFHQ